MTDHKKLEGLRSDLINLAMDEEDQEAREYLYGMIDMLAYIWADMPAGKEYRATNNGFAEIIEQTGR